MSKIQPEVLDQVVATIAEIDPDKLNDREVIAYLAGISETATGMLQLKPDLKAHADLVMDLANRVFHASKEAEARGYRRAVDRLRDQDGYHDYCRSEERAGRPGVWMRWAGPAQRDALAGYLEAVEGDGR